MRTQNPQTATQLDHSIEVLGYAMKVLLADNYDYLETSICSQFDNGLTDDHYNVGRFLEVDPNSPWQKLRLTVFDGGCSIRVDRQCFDPEWAPNDEEWETLEEYCSRMNEQQAFFSASMHPRAGLVVSSVLNREIPIMKRDVDDLLNWTINAAYIAALGVDDIESDGNMPAKAALETRTKFTDDILRSFPHHTAADMPHTPFPREE